MNPAWAGAGPVFVVDKKINLGEKHFSGVTSVKTTPRNGSREKILGKHNNTEGVSVVHLKYEIISFF